MPSLVTWASRKPPSALTSYRYPLRRSLKVSIEKPTLSFSDTLGMSRRISFSTHRSGEPS